MENGCCDSWQLFVGRTTWTARERHDRLLEPDIRDIRTAASLGTARLEAHRQAVRRGNVAAVWLATRRSLAAVAEAAHQDVAEALALEEDELPALVDGSSSDEDEPVLVDASPGKPDFSLVIVDEVSCARRQDVMAMAFALRNLETQSRGNLHAHTRMAVPHGIFYVAHSRVKNSSSPSSSFALRTCRHVFMSFHVGVYCLCGDSSVVELRVLGRYEARSPYGRPCPEGWAPWNS